MSAARPVIGISTYREPASWGQWNNVLANLSPANYAARVSAGGGTPLLLPPFGIADNIPSVVSLLDGLVISGGSDVNPSQYSQEPQPQTAGWRDDRDVSELALLHAAADLDLPTLGICRGMQMMAVHAGGTLHQHVPDLVGHDNHSPGPGIYQDNPVTTIADTKVAAILGETVTAHCHHHQSVNEHVGLVASAFCGDGILEAFEDPAKAFWVGVQWHPETGADLRLFQALSVSALTYRMARAST